jgi:hypothetical protein
MRQHVDRPRRDGPIVLVQVRGLEPAARQPVARSLSIARRQHQAAASATALAAQNTELSPRLWLIAPPATPPITPDAP